MKSEFLKKYAFLAILAGVFLLCFVWPIPRVIALRNILTATIAVLSVYACGAQVWRLGDMPKRPLLVIATLTVWIVLVIVGWGEQPRLSYRELLGHWFLPLLCGFIGLKVASIAKAYSWSPARLTTLIASGLLFGIVLHNLFVLTIGLYSGAIPLRQAPTMYLPDMFYALKNGQHVLSVLNGSTLQQLSYTNNILAALLAAELVQRILLRRQFLTFSNTVLALAVGMVLLCSYTVSVRNGNVGLIALMFFSSIFVLMNLRKRVSSKAIFASLLAVLVVVSSLGVLAYRADSRWQRVVETAPLAWDVKTGLEWLKQTNDTYPTLKDGQPVDVSAYERIGFVREGVSLIVQNPMGTGFHRNAFNYGLDKKYELNGSKSGMHAHSGLVDFTIANGIPGLLLWLAFLWSLFMVGWHVFRSANGNPNVNIAPGLMLVFLVTGFATRSIVDSVFQGYELEQFMFLSGVFYTLSALQDAPALVKEG